MDFAPEVLGLTPKPPEVSSLPADFARSSAFAFDGPLTLTDTVLAVASCPPSVPSWRLTALDSELSC